MRKYSAKAPPIKTQGIKTKLVPLIWESASSWSGQGKWIEPFLGSGAVLFNLSPQRALVGDTNEHIIRLYSDIQRGRITAEKTRTYLDKEAEFLRRDGEEHYYRVRARFNEQHEPLDFLFLNRSCFNGLTRFNGKGGFNTPFCRKPERFRQAYISRICNQVGWTAQTMVGKDWEFVCADWRAVLKSASSMDIVYADPPYAGRFTDYFNKWADTDSTDLERTLKALPCPFLYSMWAENKYRRNDDLYMSFEGYDIRTHEHFYHLGSTESLRNKMTEALVVG